MDKNENLLKINEAIKKDPANIEYTKKGYEPLYVIDKDSKIIIIGQAPGLKAQESNMAWNDLSGNKLREWLGVSREEFYNSKLFGQIPMDFYFPGHGKTGDLPPRKEFAIKWHKQILDNLEDLELIILIGNYSQKYYLDTKENLTEIVRSYKNYLPKYFPLPHPSPRNIRWFLKNPWFESHALPELKEIVRTIINKKGNN